uniref:Uncharacterized protein n=1 Tax=Lotharella oceanica TaxID=641309 RepID=A0A7S2XGG7_9EUKA|mmetsp:Transcript_33290/g.61890  ORF Transcript_33290/g.61890 Transcript_33290/m.61890 type:complete len:420 (+) Transcript_33290:63-1322(+)
MVASNHEKTYTLDLDLLKEIIPEESHYSIGTFGVSFVLKKKDKLWKRLLKDKNEKPRNMHLWWEKYDKYQDEMEKLTEREEAGSKLDKKWWKRFEHKCASCTHMIERAAFSSEAIETIRDALTTFEEKKAALAEKEAAEKDGEKSPGNSTETNTNSTETPESSEAGTDGEEPVEKTEEEKKKEKYTDTMKVAGAVLKKVCEGYDTKTLSSEFKKACKKLRKKRDVKSALLISIGTVIEMLRKDPKLNVEQIKSHFVSEQIIDTCGTRAGVCPVLPKKVSTCKACHVVVDSIHGHVGMYKEGQGPAEHEVLDSACSRATQPYSSHQDIKTVSTVCDKLVGDFDSAIIAVVRHTEKSKRRSGLVEVCREAGFCKKKKSKKKKSKDTAAAASSSSPTSSSEPTESSSSMLSGKNKPSTADEL